MPRASLQEEIEAVRGLARRLGLGPVEPQLLKAAHHTLLRLAPLDVLARVQSSEPREHAIAAAAREIAIARHLARHDAPAVRPLDAALAGPHDASGFIATLWPYVEHRPWREDRAAEPAARALAEVQAALLDYPGELPPHTRDLERCRAVLEDASASPALSGPDRLFLQRRWDELGERIQAGSPRQVPLHGDVHLGNVMAAAGGPVWCDFESACLGPVEWDLAGLPRAVWRLFPAADPDLAALHVELKSVCVAVWCWADIARSAEIREAAEHHLAWLKRGHG